MPQNTPAPAAEIPPEVAAAVAASELGAKSAALTEQLSSAFSQLKDLQGLLQSRMLESARQEVHVRQQAVLLDQREIQLSEQLAELSARENELKSQRTALDQEKSRQQAERDEFEKSRQAIDAQRRKIDQSEQDLARRQGEAAERQKTLDARHEELESFSREITEKSRAAEHAVAQLDQQRSEIEQRRAETAAEQERLRSLAQSLDARNAELSARENEFGARQSRLAEDLESLSQFEKTLESTRAQLVEQEERIKAHEQDFVRREAAMRQFQDAMKGIAAAFGGALPIDPAAMAAVHMPPPRPVEPSPSIVPAQAHRPVGDETSNGAQTESPPPQSQAVGPARERVAAHAAPEDHAGDDEPATPSESRAAPDPPASDALPRGARQPVASPAEPDESTLSPDELKKLKVLRRLTGGRTSDAELLARIRHEAGAATPEASQPGAKKKKSWW